MEPEFLRLQQLHEREIEEVKVNAQLEERKLRETLKLQCHSNIEDERNNSKDEFKSVLQTIQQQYSHEMEQVIRQHKHSQRLMQSEADQDLAQYQIQCQEKHNQRRKTWYDEITSLQDVSNQRLLELQRKHRQHVEEVHREHDQQLQQLQQSHQQEKKKLLKTLQSSSELSPLLSSTSNKSSGHFSDSDLENESKAEAKSQQSSPTRRRQQKTSNRSHDDEDDEDDEIRIRDPLSPSKFVSKGLLKDSKALPSSPPRTKTTTKTTKKKTSTSLDIKQLSLEYQQKYDIARREAEQQRDKQIQSEIRMLEGDMMQLERELNLRTQQERQKIEQLEVKEEQNLQKRCQQLQIEVQDLTKQREVLYTQVTEVTQREIHFQEQIEQVKHEIQVYKEGIKAHKNRMSEKEEQERYALKTLEMEYNPRIKELRMKLEACEKRIQDKQQRWDEQMEVLKEEHGRELNKLDREVKSEVAKREAEIVQLREQLEDTHTKLNKIQTLIEKYDKQLHGGTDDQASSNVRNTNRGVASSSRAAPAASTVDRDGDASYRSIRTTSTISTRSTLRPTHLQSMGGNNTANAARRAFSTTHK